MRISDVSKFVRPVLEIEKVSSLTPEQKLCVAVLNRALMDAALFMLNRNIDISDYLRRGYYNSYEFKNKTFNWFYSDSEVEFSLNWCCQAIWEDWEGKRNKIRVFIQDLSTPDKLKKAEECLFNSAKNN